MASRLLAACLLFSWVGCGKEPAPASTPQTSHDRTAGPAEPAAAPQPDPAPPRAAPETQAATLLHDLTQIVRKYAAEQRRVPKSLEELAAQGYLARVPPAPAGKRFAIDKNLEVYLANQ